MRASIRQGLYLVLGVTSCTLCAGPAVTDLALEGMIEGGNIRFSLQCQVIPGDLGADLPLIRGDTVIESCRLPPDPDLRFDSAAETYILGVPAARRGWFSRPEPAPIPLDVTFAARPTVMPDGWHEVRFEIPPSQVRRLNIICDRTDLDVRFPHALNVRRTLEQNQLRVTALLGPGHPFAVRWKPEVEELEGKLVVSAEVNTVARVTAGALRLDCLYAYQIAQGEMTAIELAVPPEISITQVRGKDIREWNVTGDENRRALTVTLSRPQRESYRLQLLAEYPLGPLPLQTDVPLPRPVELIRERGALAVGTDHAIQVQVTEATGFTQVDATAFPRLTLASSASREPPAHQLFCYTHVGGALSLRLSLADIVPNYDVNQRLILSFTEEDLDVDAELELDIRDAPIRRLEIALPAGLAVAHVAGDGVEDYAVRSTPGTPPSLQVMFAEPVQGRRLLSVQLELGESPLDREQTVTALEVMGARGTRGYVLLTAEEGIRLDAPGTEGLRDVHAASLPVKVADVRFAYRFREPDWRLTVTPAREPATVLAETFHLFSIGEGIVYGTVVANYVVTGAPVDRLSFIVPESLRHVEFIGTDVRRWSREGTLCTVLLQRRVIGEYNLGVAFTQPLNDGRPLLVGAVSCAEVATQRGFIAVASRHNLRLTTLQERMQGLIPIDSEEIPDHYRLLVHAPVLAAFKYVGTPHQTQLQAELYDRGDVVAALIELSDMETHVTVDRHRGAPQTVTRARCKIKNLNRQFLSMSLPPNTSYSRVRLVRIENQQEIGEHVAVRQGSEADTLLIPLPRLPNPNEPLTLDIEYGQNHAAVSPGSVILVKAPDLSIAATFATWTVTLDEPRGILVPEPAQCSVRPNERPQAGRHPSRLLQTLAHAWATAGAQTAHVFAAAILCGIILFVFVACLLARLPFPRAGAAAMLAGLCVMGILALASTESRSHASWEQTWRALTVTEAALLGGEGATIAFRVVPAYQRWLNLPAVSWALAALVIGGVGTALLRGRLRLIPLVLLFTALAWLAPLHPSIERVLLHLFTWALPVILGAAWLVRASRRRAAALAGACGLLLCATASAREDNRALPASPAAVIEQSRADPVVLTELSCELTADDTTTRGDMTITLRKGRAVEVIVLPPTAVVLTHFDDSQAVSLRHTEAGYLLNADGRDTPDTVRMRFLAPLPEADDAGLRRFTLALPAAMTKRVSLTVPRTGIRIEAPNAILFEQHDTPDTTRAETLLGPKDDATFAWKPRERQTEFEKTVFFTDSACLIRIDPGIAQAWQHIRFQVAQGELAQIRLKLPETMTVTSVSGEHIGAWRFDPAEREVDVRLAPAVTGIYTLALRAQLAMPAGHPGQLTLTSARIPAAERQRIILGIAQSKAVDLGIEAEAAPMNPDDFIREAGALNESAGVQTSLHSAYRLTPGETILAAVSEVEPEVRVVEHAGFTVSDERLVYTGELHTTIAKAGRFSLTLALPPGYDVDALAANEMSHWDDVGTPEKRLVRLHFRRQIEEDIVIRIGLSQPLAELPAHIDLPRIGIQDALRHTGSLTVSSDHSVRLSVERSESTGISDVSGHDPALRRQGMLSFRLLSADWRLLLRTEIIQPRVTVDFLHVARVSEGLTRHTHYLRYQMQHAGIKRLRFSVPANAVGIQVSGPDIARRGAVNSGPQWEVELTRKVHEQPYLLRVSYETRFDRDDGVVVLDPVSPEGVDLQRGYVAVVAGDRVELRADHSSALLQPVDARRVPTFFGAGQLSQAAFCYRGVSGDYRAAFTVRRHASAGLEAADVRETELESVISRDGASLNRLRLVLGAHGRRHVRITLPPGAHIWSLLVNQMAQTPALVVTDRPRVLVALPEQQGPMDAEVVLVYVRGAPDNWNPRRPAFQGPTADLPLKNVRWTLYLPEGLDCNAFEGSLNPSAEEHPVTSISQYNAGVYDVQVERSNQALLRKAEQFQTEGTELAQQGRQLEAKVALQNAYNYSQGDLGLNEDARVQLHSLIRQQAIVGLVGRRNQLRTEFNVKGAQPRHAPGQALHFNPDEAQRLQSSLSKLDNDNLQRISARIIEGQEAAVGAARQLTVTLPRHGTRVDLRKSLLVEPDAELSIAFLTAPEEKQLWPDLAAAGGMGIIAGVLLTAAGAGKRRRSSAETTTGENTQNTMPPPIPAAQSEADEAGTAAEGTPEA